MQRPHRITDMRRTLLALSLVVVAGIAIGGSPDRFAYVYKRGNDTTMRINGSIDSFQRIAKRWSGEYIWVSRNGKEWLIRDAAMLASARDAFKDMEALEPALRAAEEKVVPLEERMDEITDADREPPAELERALEAAEREAERLEREMDRREEIAEAKFEKLVLRAIDSGKAQRVD